MRMPLLSGNQSSDNTARHWMGEGQLTYLSLRWKERLAKYWWQRYTAV